MYREYPQEEDSSSSEKEDDESKVRFRSNIIDHAFLKCVMFSCMTSCNVSMVIANRPQKRESMHAFVHIEKKRSLWKESNEEVTASSLSVLAMPKSRCLSILYFPVSRNQTL